MASKLDIFVTYVLSLPASEIQEPSFQDRVRRRDPGTLAAMRTAIDIAEQRQGAQRYDEETQQREAELAPNVDVLTDAIMGVLRAGPFSAKDPELYHRRVAEQMGAPLTDLTRRLIGEVMQKLTNEGRVTLVREPQLQFELGPGAAEVETVDAGATVEPAEPLNLEPQLQARVRKRLLDDELAVLQARETSNSNEAVAGQLGRKVFDILIDMLAKAERGELPAGYSQLIEGKIGVAAFVRELVPAFRNQVFKLPAPEAATASPEPAPPPGGVPAPGVEDLRSIASAAVWLRKMAGDRYDIVSQVAPPDSTEAYRLVVLEDQTTPVPLSAHYDYSGLSDAPEALAELLADPMLWAHLGLDAPPAKPPRITKPSAGLALLRRAGEGRDSNWDILLVKELSGDWSIPKGVIEPGDESPRAAALRETSEEVGLPAGQMDWIASELTRYQGFHPLDAVSYGPFSIDGLTFWVVDVTDLDMLDEYEPFGEAKTEISEIAFWELTRAKEALPGWQRGLIDIVWAQHLRREGEPVAKVVVEPHIIRVRQVVNATEAQELALPGDPFRAPHHSIGASAMVAESQVAKGGVLFLDDLGSFNERVVAQMAVDIRARPRNIVIAYSVHEGNEPSHALLRDLYAAANDVPPSAPKPGVKAKLEPEHPRAISRDRIEPDERYTLWQRVGESWVIERTLGGAHIKGDDAYWVDLAKRAGTSRPLAFFEEGDDPNWMSRFKVGDRVVYKDQRGVVHRIPFGGKYGPLDFVTFVPDGSTIGNVLEARLLEPELKPKPLTAAVQAAATLKDRLEPIMGDYDLSVYKWSILGEDGVTIDWFRLHPGEKPPGNIKENAPGFRISISAPEGSVWRTGQDLDGKLTVEMLSVHGDWKTWPKLRKYTTRKAGLEGIYQAIKYVVKWFEKNRGMLVGEPAPAVVEPAPPTIGDAATQMRALVAGSVIQETVPAPGAASIGSTSLRYFQKAGKNDWRVFVPPGRATATNLATDMLAERGLFRVVTRGKPDADDLATMWPAVEPVLVSPVFRLARDLHRTGKPHTLDYRLHGLARNTAYSGMQRTWIGEFKAEEGVNAGQWVADWTMPEVSLLNDQDWREAAKRFNVADIIEATPAAPTLPTTPASPVSAAPPPVELQPSVSWTSPIYGKVRIVTREGRQDMWHNIRATVNGEPVGYAYNGKRWARRAVPPQDLLDEVAAHGHGERFGLTVAA